MMRQRHGPDWELILAEGACRKCGISSEKLAEKGQKLQIDHIVPVTFGGSRTDRSNQQPLCPDCNAKKQTLDGARFQYFKMMNEERKQLRHLRQIAVDG